MPIPMVMDPPRKCRVCATSLARKRFASGRLEDRTVFLKRECCSQSCANTKTAVTKDALHWRARKYLRPACEECGRTDRLHVHHKDRNPANNDPTNLLTLCASCHLRLHWREDRPQRLVAIRRGARMRQRSIAGNESSVA